MAGGTAGLMGAEGEVIVHYVDLVPEGSACGQYNLAQYNALGGHFLSISLNTHCVVSWCSG